MKRTRPQPLQLVRYGVQAAVGLYVIVEVIANTVGQAWAANLHSICPFGGVANLYTYLSGGGYVSKLHSAVFIMLLALVIGLVLTGKSFCGWICPLGSVQQALGSIGQRLWPRLYNKVPRRVEQVLQYLKWAVLAWVLIQTARSGQLIFQDWDPYYNLFRIWTDEIAISGYAVVGATLLLAVLVPRPFCRYACPLGAFNGIFNSFSFITIKRSAKTCTDCGKCTEVCPVNINVGVANVVRSIECTRCLKCVDACSRNLVERDTLQVRTWFSGLSGLRRDKAASEASAAVAVTKRRRRRSKVRWVFAVVAVAAFVLPILIANLSGNFTIAGGGSGGGEGTGTTSTITVKGSTTLADMQASGANLGELFNKFGIPATTSLDTALRDLTDEYGFTIEDVRAYLGIAGE